MANICSKPCVDISILSGAYINKCQILLLFFFFKKKNIHVINKQINKIKSLLMQPIFFFFFFSVIKIFIK